MLTLPSHQYKTTLCGVILATIWACGGGVSKSRVDALEAQLNELKQASQAGGAAGENPAGLEDRINAVESSTNEAQAKMEQMLEVLQREVSRLSDSQAKSTPDASSPQSGGGSTTDLWHHASLALGVASQGVQADEDQLTIPRDWLSHELSMIALKGKAPKFAAAKDGVAVRGVRPKSLGAMLGLKNGDVIVSIGETPVKSAEEILNALKALEGPRTSVKLMRRKKETVLTYALAE